MTALLMAALTDGGAGDRSCSTLDLEAREREPRSGRRLRSRRCRRPRADRAAPGREAYGRVVGISRRQDRSRRAAGEYLDRELKEELGIIVDETCLAPLTFASHSYPDFH